MATKPTKSTTKSSVRRRLRMVGGSQQGPAVLPGGEQDVKRRLGNFETAGEHARVGGRTSDIVGQKTSRFKTDKRLKATRRSK